MKNFPLPKLPEGCQYGAEIILRHPASGEFHAPAGHAIKSIDFEAENVVCVPIQKLVNGQWVTIQD
ncbi:MAG TPA: hypothetical protein VGN40_21445 [Lelliottia sp.]|jgi:hypothetical protein